jgi:hypothetical protein
MMLLLLLLLMFLINAVLLLLPMQQSLQPSQQLLNLTCDDSDLLLSFVILQKGVDSFLELHLLVHLNLLYLCLHLHLDAELLHRPKNVVVCRITRLRGIRLC